jgi:hypothetical protein
MSEAVGNFADSMPKTSIGNYKGVMLCNRPNEMGQSKRVDSGMPQPFQSGGRNDNLNPTGWNPCQKLLPKSRRKDNGYKLVLARHKQYL